MSKFIQISGISAINKGLYPLESLISASSPEDDKVLLKFKGSQSTVATATAVAGFPVTATVTGGGSGYSSAPTLTVTGGGGTGCTMTCTISGNAVNAVNITNAGSGYTTPPEVAVTGGGGTNAKITAALESGAGVVKSITINRPGGFYTSVPSVAVTGNCESVATVTNGRVTALTIAGTNSSYSASPTVSISSPGYTPAISTDEVLVVVEPGRASSFMNEVAGGTEIIPGNGVVVSIETFTRGTF